MTYHPKRELIDELHYDITTLIEPDISRPEVAALIGRRAFQAIVSAAQAEAWTNGYEQTQEADNPYKENRA